MFIQPVNSFSYNKINYSTPKTPYFKGIFKKSDIFLKSNLTEENLKIVESLRRFVERYKISSKRLSVFSSTLNNANCKTLLNICVYAAGAGYLTQIFEKTEGYDAVKNVLAATNEMNRDFVEYYTSLGGQSGLVISKTNPDLRNRIFDMNLDYIRPVTIDKIISTLTDKNADAVTALVNSKLMTSQELYNYLTRLSRYNETESANIVHNIENGVANYVIEVAYDIKHPLKKNLNTIDFKKNGSPFTILINPRLNNSYSIFDFLKYPFEDKKHFNKVLRNTGSLMSRVYKNEKSKFGYDEDTEGELAAFFVDNIMYLIGMMALTDEETVLQIFDRGLDNARQFLQPIEKYTIKDEEVLSKAVKKGKRINKNGEFVNISARDKVYFCRLVNMNRKNLAVILKDIDLEKSLTELENGGVQINFEYIENQIKKIVLNRCGFSDEEINKLRPEDINWDLRYMYQLAKMIEPGLALDSVVQSASRGKFKEYINDPYNKYGYANMQTKEIFENMGLDYQKWLEGVPEEKFEAGGEKLSICLWKRIPQKSIFNGSYTTCCTALDAPQGKSMPNYLLHTAFNIIEIKNENNETVAQSRVYTVNPDNPVFVVDNIEVNNTFKKKLVTNKQKDEFMENIFSYIRKYAKSLTDKDLPVYFAKENNKLYSTTDLTAYPLEWVLMKGIAGKLADYSIYCNAITNTFASLKDALVVFYDVTEEVKNGNEDENLQFLNDF